MKNLILILASSFLFAILGSCSSQSAIAPEKVSALLNSGEFTFIAQRANPMNMDVVNVMNSLPGSSSTRILDLDYGYTVQISKDQLEVTLPYFGRLYNPSYDTIKNGFRFTSKDYKVTQEDGRKGSKVFYITVNDQQNIRKMNLEVFKNGKAYLSIDANDRQPISYDGYIMENSTKK